jgi:hypothetical protein
LNGVTSLVRHTSALFFSLGYFITHRSDATALVHQTDFRIVRILIANMYEHAWVYAGGIHKSTMSYWSKMGKQELIKTKQYLKGNRNSMLTTCFLFLVSALSQANVGGFQCLRLAVRPIVRYVSTHVLYMH